MTLMIMWWVPGWKGDGGQTSMWAESMHTGQLMESNFSVEQLHRPLSSYSHSRGSVVSGSRQDQKPGSKMCLQAAVGQGTKGCWLSSPGRWMRRTQVTHIYLREQPSQVLSQMQWVNLSQFAKYLAQRKYVANDPLSRN